MRIGRSGLLNTSIRVCRKRQGSRRVGDMTTPLAPVFVEAISFVR